MFLRTYPLAPEYKKEKILEDLTDIINIRGDLILQSSNLNLKKLLSFKASFQNYLDQNQKFSWVNNHKSLKYAASFFHYIRTNLKQATDVIEQMNQAQLKVNVEETQKNALPNKSNINAKFKIEAEAVFIALENIRNIYLEMKTNHINGFVRDNIKTILHAFDCYKDEQMNKMRESMKYITRVDASRRLHSPI